MRELLRGRRRLLAASAALLLGACVVADDGDTAAADTARDRPGDVAAAPAPGDPAGTTAAPGMAGAAESVPLLGDTTAPRTPSARLRVEVDVQARELHVLRDGARVATHGVAVGTDEWPTQTGEWTIDQVVWNPEWIPPDESWAEDSERKAPGAPDNPLGRVQLVYDLPRTIHGTNEPESIGQAVSHGSIRMRNDVAIELARLLMEETGAGRDESWYRQAREQRTEKRVVDLPQPVPIRVY